MLSFVNNNIQVSVSVLVLGILLFLLTLFFTVLLNKILLKFSTNLGVRDQSSIQIRWTATTKPSLGGVAFFVFFLFSFLVYQTFLRANEDNILEYLTFMLVGSIAFLMGLADDAYNTRPWLKFSIQLFCSALFIISGNYIKTFPNEYLNYFMTLLWVIGLMNSINMLDNMDAITTSVSWGIIATIIALNIVSKSSSAFYLIISVGVLGSLTGFYYHNWHPSKMYMGDSGSQFLGILLAWLGVKFFWNGLDFYGQPIQMKQFLMAGMLFIAPISDTTTVTINRILRGVSPFTGGRDHTTHAFVYNGWEQRHVPIIFLGITLLSGAIIVFFFNFVKEWNHWYSAFGIFYMLVVFISLFLTTKTKDFKNKV